MQHQFPQFIFFGTPDVARTTLELLKKKDILPIAIVTSPDRPSGRGMHIAETPVSLWAKENTIPCFKPEKITPEFIDDLIKISSELFIVVAYGKILPQMLIDVPTYKTINIHYSLLPRYRGASPVEQALLNGDTHTGVTIQEMQFKLDSGPILATHEEVIDITDTKESLRARLIEIGVALLVETVPKIRNGTVTKEVQDETKASHCSKIKKEDGEILLHANPVENYNKYRAFEGWPGVYFFIEKQGKPMRVKITKAIYENNSFIIKRVVPEGKKETSYDEFVKTLTLK